MPKETFYNLPKEKRIRIENAARNEFTNNVLLKSRVSNVIKEADIPRGSFYQYFEDLDDLYFYILDLTFDEIYSTGLKVSDETNNLFEFVVKSFEYDYENYHLDHRKSYMQNAVRSLSDNEKYNEELRNKNEMYITHILEKMDLSNIKITDKKELIKMYHYLQGTKREVIHRSMMKKVTKEEAISELEWYLNILQNGLVEE